MLSQQKPLKSESDLIERCQTIEGLTLAQLASMLDIEIPKNPVQRKGWAGQAIEIALGTTAGTKSLPDFCNLGIELKTLPVNTQGKPAESTFVTTIPLLTVHQQSWYTSQCFAKLQRVLWMPIEGDKAIPFPHRRIGQGILWSPNQEEVAILENDWQELTFMIGTGKLAEIDAAMGQYLQVRPKAANGRTLSYGYDSQGNKTLTLPRGFYLRSSFTAKIISKYNIMSHE